MVHITDCETVVARNDDYEKKHENQHTKRVNIKYKQIIFWMSRHRIIAHSFAAFVQLHHGMDAFAVGIIAEACKSHAK